MNYDRPFKVLRWNRKISRISLVAAFVTLAGCGQPTTTAISIPALIEDLNGMEPGARLAAARAFSKKGPEAKDAIPALVRALEDPDGKMRYYTVKSLSKIGADSTAVPGLAKLLADSDPEIRYYTVKTISKIGPPADAAVPALTERLKDADPRIRYYAAKALGKIGPAARTAVAPLQSAVQDSDMDTRKAATEALRRIDGKS